MAIVFFQIQPTKPKYEMFYENSKKKKKKKKNEVKL